MIVISLILVIAAAVSLFIGLFVATETLTFIWGAIGLCLLSLLLLWLGTRQRKRAAPTKPSAPVYGGAARAGATTPARAGTDEDLDELTSPDGGTVVRKTTARQRATSRVASGPSDDDDTVVIGDSSDQPEPEPEADEAAAESDASVATRTPKKKAVVRKVPVKKATKRATAKKGTKKAAAKKGTKKAAAKKGTKKATAGTTGAEARARLAQIAGVGPAKQDALLAQYGSLEAIRDASVDDIVANVRGFGEALASRVKSELG